MDEAIKQQLIVAGYNTVFILGFVVILGLQTLIIIGGVMKLLPLTGITLPFVSYGGTSLFVSLGMMGILTYLIRKTLKFARKEGETYEE